MAKFEPGNPGGPGRPKGSKSRVSFRSLKDQLAESSFNMVEHLEKLLNDPKASLDFRFSVLQWLVKVTEPKQEDTTKLTNEDLLKALDEG
jgi:hypothetical protein